MKKFYMLLVATIFVVSASAQVSVKSVSERHDRQLPYKAVEKNTLRVKSEAGAEWVYPAISDAIFYGADQLVQGSTFSLAFDSTGYIEYSDGLGHPYVFSAGQTFDFLSLFYDDASTPGQSISFHATNSLTIDSVEIYTLYFREEGIPAGSKDTVIIGIYTDSEFTDGVYRPDDGICFWGLYYDPATGVQTGAHIYKFAIGDDEVSQPHPTDSGYYVASDLVFPINLTTTDKAIHIAYTFKRGYELGMEDTLKSTFRLLTWKSSDPNYNYPGNSETRCYNQSHGDYIRVFVEEDGSEEVNSYYYPGWGITSTNPNFSCHYPRMGALFSCTECEVVNVPEIEKNNPTIYPNPATNNFTVNLGNDEKANIQLFNIVGQQVYSETITGTAQVNVSNLNSGVYMLKINQNGKVYTTKVIVK